MEALKQALENPFYETIKQVAEEKNLSITQLAKRADIPERNLWYFKNKEPKGFQILRKLLNVSINDKT